MLSGILSLIIIVLLLPVPYNAICQTVNIPVADTVLSTLHTSHPRLMMNESGLEHIKLRQKSDATLRKYVRDVMKKADDYCLKPALSYEAREGYRLIFVSRECMHRMYTLGMAWRLTGDEKYARKAQDDLLAVCALENWRPSLAIIYPNEPKYKNNPQYGSRPPFSFLDVSEMTHAVGIGYDWFYSYMSPETRETIKSGLIRHGLDEGVIAYTGKGSPSGQPAEGVSY